MKIAWFLIINILLLLLSAQAQSYTGNLNLQGKMDHDSWKDGYAMGKAVGIIEGIGIVLSPTSDWHVGYAESIAKYNEIVSVINFGIQFKNMQLQLMFPANYSDILIEPLKNISLTYPKM
jgi:hypothetical protein